MKYGIPLCRRPPGRRARRAGERPVPKDSVRVSIPGCSKGSAFVVTESPEGERTSVEIKTGRRFRLTGKKELLNEIKAREGYMIEVTGIVRKNDLAGPGGITLGGGRVRIGGGAPRVERRQPDAGAAVGERDPRCRGIPPAGRAVPEVR